MFHGKITSSRAIDSGLLRAGSIITLRETDQEVGNPAFKAGLPVENCDFLTSG